MFFENGAQYGLGILKRELEYERINGKKIIIFGFNNGARLCVYYLRSLSLSPIAIVDNSKKVREERKYYRGVPVCAPEDVLKTTDENTLIVIPARRAAEIKANVLEINPRLEENIITFYLQDNSKMFEPWGNESECQQVDLREGQLEMLEMMKELHLFCEKKGIKYVLTYGSLIGAVRHKGFIPWDDYLKFCKEIEKEKVFNYNCIFCEDSKMRTISTITQIVSNNIYSEYHNYPLRTSQGVTIDVWPLVNFPDDINEQKEYEYELIDAGDEWKESVVIPFTTESYSRERHEAMIARLHEIMNRYSGKDTSYVGDGYCGTLEDPLREGRAFKKELCEKRQLVDFEDAKFWIPEGYNEILSSIYGDYMQVPDKDKQVPSTYQMMYKKES